MYVGTKNLSICQNNPVAGPPRKSKKNQDDDEEILSDASDVEGRPGKNGDAGYESVDDGDGGDDLRETAEEKAVRLAKIHLEEIEREGELGKLKFDGCGLKVTVYKFTMS